MNVISPASPQEAQALADRLGTRASFIAGGTVVQLAWTDARLAPPDHCFINTMCWPESQHITLDDRYLRIGAQARLESIRTHALAQTHAPMLCTAIGQLGALGVRRLGTLGGNVGWGVGDTGPVLLVLDADVQLADGSWQPLNHVLQQPVRPLMLAFRIRRTDTQAPLHTAFEKIGYRAAFTPARIRVAMRWREATRGSTLSHVAAGAPGAPIRRLSTVEQLMGQGDTSIDLGRVRHACQQDLPADMALLASRLIAGHCGLL